MCIVIARCPICLRNTPHNTLGEQADSDGKNYQTMQCTVCKTSNKVYSGNDGEDFQPNYDCPDNTTI